MLSCDIYGYNVLTDSLIGTSDRHNDYAHRATEDIVGSNPGQNVTEALQSDGTVAGRPGETKFGSQAFKEDSGSRDTHQVQPKNGTTLSFEDHKEDFHRDGKKSEAHSSNPDGTRVDAEENVFHQSNSLADVQHKNGALDSVHKDTKQSDWSGKFQKHHADLDLSDSKDSKLTGDVHSDLQHQKEEHKDANVHTLHEESSSKNSFSWNVVGDNALKDLTTESSNWPKIAPRDSSYIEVRPTAEQGITRRDEAKEEPLGGHKLPKVIQQTGSDKYVHANERRNGDHAGTHDVYVCAGKHSNRVCMPQIVKRGDDNDDEDQTTPVRPKLKTFEDLSKSYETLWDANLEWRKANLKLEKYAHAAESENHKLVIWTSVLCGLLAVVTLLLTILMFKSAPLFKAKRDEERRKREVANAGIPLEALGRPYQRLAD